MMDDAEFAGMMDRARAGNAEAQALLLSAFEADVRSAVRGRLPRVLRARYDSMDFVQDVWGSLLAGGPDPDEFRTVAQFRRYLAGMARNKVLEEFRRRTRTRKFDLGREEPLYVRRGGSDAPRDLPSPDPSPSQEAQAEECFDRLSAGPDPRQAAIVALRRQGLTVEEVAQRLGLREWTVRRVLEAARKRLDEGGKR